MQNQKILLIQDTSAAFLSVLLFGWAVIFISFDGDVNFIRFGFDSIAGGLAYLLGFLIFSERGLWSRVRKVLFATVLGSCIWIVYKIVKGIFVDIEFLNEFPQQFFQRHVVSGFKIFITIVPILTLNACLFVAVIQFVKKLLLKFSVTKFS